MKNISPILTFFFSFLTLISFSQNQTPQSIQQVFSSFDQEMAWVKVQPNQVNSASNFFQNHYQLFGLERAEDMQLAKSETDKLGWKHYRYHQYHKGVRVEGGTYILHERDGKVEKANGHLFNKIQINTIPRLDKGQILDKALAAYPADRYAWENPISEKIRQRIQKNPRATHFPEPELVILDRTYPKRSGDYALAYKFIIKREAPMMDRRQLWYDAHSGELLLDVNLMHETHGEEGTAVTRYHGERKIITRKDENGNYILRDSTRGGGIETYNDNYSDFDNGVLADFIDDDNYWNNVNAEQDEVATDAHFGAMVTYDFFKDNFGRNSFDDLSSPLISMVHVGDNFNNAFWDGEKMSYGDGDSIRFFPLVALDVCGHEVAHGVTQFSANLIYRDESGALNESFSDIFGKTIEALYAPEEFSWVLGERMLVDKDNIFRDMSDPIRGEDPKYYGGELWVDGAGVHTNSGVQNYWYYLLVEGAQGTNEVGYTYDIPALGWEKAMQIAYRNLTVYLTESSPYKDARRGSLEAAKDLYGFCSEEYRAVADAWAVVGLGSPLAEGDYLIDFDVLQEDACEISETAVNITIFNNSCNTTLTSGTEIALNYQLDNEAVVTERFTVPTNISPAETFNYTFNQLVENPSIGEHTIKAWFDIDNDPSNTNDTLSYIFENKVYQNTDFAFQEPFNFNGICDPLTERRVFTPAIYDGCDTLRNTPNDIFVPYKITFKGDVLEETYRSFRDLAPADRFFISERLDVNYYGFGYAESELLFPGDLNASNNFAYAFLARLRESSVGYLEPFNNGQLDSTHMSIESRPLAQHAIQEENGSYSLLATGSSIFDNEDNLQVRKSDEAERFFAINSNFHSRLTLCVDLIGLSNPALVMDFKLSQSDVDYEAYDINPEFASMIGIRIDGNLDTLIYGTDLTDWTNLRMDLSNYTDETHEITITPLGLTGLLDNSNTILAEGDNVYIDNVQIDLGTSIRNTNNALETVMQIAPNPSANSFILNRRDQSAFDRQQINLIDATGKILLQDQLNPQMSNFEFGEDLQPGIYFLHIVDGEKSGYLKLVKQ